MRQSPLDVQMKKSGFRQRSPLTGGDKVEARKGIQASLALTPLVDAFAILVIYLLVNTGSSSDLLEYEKGIEMPQASQAQMLDKGIVVSFKKGSYYIDKQKVNRTQLVDKLIENLEASGKQVVIHADKKSNYSSLNPILLASAEAGYTKIKFAVVQGGDQ